MFSSYYHFRFADRNDALVDGIEVNMKFFMLKNAKLELQPGKVSLDSSYLTYLLLGEPLAGVLPSAEADFTSEFESYLASVYVNIEKIGEKARKVEGCNCVIGIWDIKGLEKAFDVCELHKEIRDENEIWPLGKCGNKSYSKEEFMKYITKPQVIWVDDMDQLLKNFSM